MELNILEESIAVGKTVFEQTVEQPLDAEFTLPDYFPEIERILKCLVKPSVMSNVQSGGSLTVDGTAFITLIYSSSEGEVYGFDYQLPFSRTVEIASGGASGNLSVTCGAAADYVGCRAISPRRVSVHSSAALRIKAVEKRDVGIIADIDDKTVQTLKGQCMARVPMASVEKQFILEEEIKLDSGKTSVSIIRTCGDAVSNDCKIINNKAVIKGKLTLSALYKSDSGLDTLKTDIPVSQIVDIEGANENCSCISDFEVLSLELRPKTGISGEIGSFALTARLCVKAEAFCSNELSLVYDAFCTRFETTLAKSDIVLERQVQQIEDVLVCKKSLDFSDGAVSEICDMWCTLGPENVRREESGIVLSGDIQVHMLAKDQSGSMVFFERTVDYEYRAVSEQMPSKMKCSTSVHLGGVSFVQQGGSVELRAEINISAIVSEVTGVCVVSGIEVLEDKPKASRPDSSLVMYFAAKGEKLWDIARMYNTSCDEIMTVNELGGDTIVADRMLLIPCLY